MFQKIISKVTAFSSKIKSSISFLPTIITIIAFALGILLVTFKSLKINDFIVDNLKFITIHNIDTLRAILTTFLAAIISMTIFSFSMVMIVLSQAATNYSPKILSWLVSKRKHQYILGAYLGTIIFVLILLLKIPKDVDFQPLYHIGVYLAALFTFYSVSLFVVFINNVSNDVQVYNIIEDIFNQTLNKLKKEKGTCVSEDRLNKEHMKEWIPYHSDNSGYLQKVRSKQLLKLAKKHDFKIKVNQVFGYYYLKGSSLYSLNKAIEDKSLVNSINSTFIYYTGERIQDHAFYGFRQLSEIAVKALSPAMNNTGTAQTCIDYLSDLFSRKMEEEDVNIICDDEGMPKIFIYNYSLKELINICMLPILQYGSQDIHILEGLMDFVKKLSQKDKDKKFKGPLTGFLDAIFIEMDYQKENGYYYDYLQNKKRDTLNSDYFLH